MRYLVSFCLVVLFIVLFSSCKQRQDVIQQPETQTFLEETDAFPSDEVQRIVYSIPSPHQVSMLIREDYPHYAPEIFRKKIDINNYATSEKKALILGALCADLGYLSLYDQKELSIQYLNHIRTLVEAPRLGDYNPVELFKRMEQNLGNSDSTISIISKILRNENKSIRSSERPYISSLIIAGGWIESFYILNTLYNNSKNSNLFGILLQQQYVVENLIRHLRPFYKKSREYTELIDKLVEIAYEFEVVDVLYRNIPAENSGNITSVKCRFTPVLTGSQLDRMHELSGMLRQSLIN